MHTLFAGNLAETDSQCAFRFMSVNSAGYNIGNGCPFNDETDITDLDPTLEPLADNGGSTRTHAIAAGTAMHDGGAETCPDPQDFFNPELATDQRGLPRPLGAACDIGAFELQE